MSRKMLWDIEFKSTQVLWNGWNSYCNERSRGCLAPRDWSVTMIYWSEDRKLVESEFIRMGFNKDNKWRISDINKNFELCNTYPRYLIIPSAFRDEDLDAVAKFRYFRRIPTAVWRHIKNGCFIVRSSQPTVGWFGWFRSDLDESLVQSYVSNTPDSESNIDANGKNDSQLDNQSEGFPIQETPQDDQVLLHKMTNTSQNQTTSPSITNNTTFPMAILDQSQEPTTNADDTDRLNQNVDQNNHNNNLQGATKVLLSSSGKTIKLEVDSNVDSLNDSESIPSAQYTSAPTITHNGNGVSQLDNSISSVIDNNTTAATTTSKMLIIDARSYTAAMANRAKGGGCECSEYYQRCEVQFMNLANIHSIRKSFHAIRGVCEAYSEQSNNWLSFLDNSRWLHHISGLLKSASLVVDAIDVEEKSILIHCSDGWDRTPQIIALAEIMLDPHYRTFDGFRTLIEREWLDFGHKFADRCGSNPCNEDPNERCPVFLQWLDCVQQLLVQYPRHFEFNSLYLDKLNRHTYSNVFGTFSYNSTQERILSRVDEKLLSLWSYFDSSRRKFTNENYLESNEVLRPSNKLRDLHFWKEVYLPPVRNQTPYMPITNNLDNKKFYDSLYIDGLMRTVCK